MLSLSLILSSSVRAILYILGFTSGVSQWKSILLFLERFLTASSNITRCGVLAYRNCPNKSKDCLALKQHYRQGLEASALP